MAAAHTAAAAAAAAAVTPYPDAPPSARIVCVELKPGDRLPTDLPPTAKILHLVRHGEAAHNLLAAQRYQGKYPCACPGECIFTSESLRDASLTERGRRQASASGARILARPPFPQLALASPLTRTLQTAHAALALAGLRALRCVVLEGCRERSGVHVADMRSPRAAVEPAFPPSFDFSAIDHGPDLRFDRAAREPVDHLVRRARGFFWALRHRPERCLALFSHSSFLTNSIRHAFHTPDEGVVRGFANGEHRCVILTFEET